MEFLGKPYGKDPTSPINNVTKRSGKLQKFDENKLILRIERLIRNLPSYDSSNYHKCSQDIQSRDFIPFVHIKPIITHLEEGLIEEISTFNLDDLLIEVCQSIQSMHPDYGRLAGSIAVTRLWKSVPESFSETVKRNEGLYFSTKNDNFYLNLIENDKSDEESCNDVYSTESRNVYSTETKRAIISNFNQRVSEVSGIAYNHSDERTKSEDYSSSNDLRNPKNLRRPDNLSALNMSNTKEFHDSEKEIGASSILYDKNFYDFVMENAETLDQAISQDRDFNFDLVGYKIMEKTYLIRINGQIMERPQHMFMRVAVCIHLGDINAALDTYSLMSQNYFIHATPTLYSAGLFKQHFSSCYLMPLESSEVSGVYETIKKAAIISSNGGGIGIACHGILSAVGSEFETSPTTISTGGVIPIMKVLNETCRYVNQGGNKRKGAFAIYLEPWHPDCMEFLDSRRLNARGDIVASDLFTALWVPDLFMKRVKNDEIWTFMDPINCPGLNHCSGDAFERLYKRYEKQNRGYFQIPAREVWVKMVISQIETGTPYLLFKDACNFLSNQKELGCIQCSNLCAEIVQYSDENEIACCNLASICLSKYILDINAFKIKESVDNLTETLEKAYDFKLLGEVVRKIVRNLNKLIDYDCLPHKECIKSNSEHRPIGIGVQGLADTFCILHLSYESNEAKILQLRIYETIYYHSLLESCEMSKFDGPYQSFPNSPISKGYFQFDLLKLRYETLYNKGWLDKNIIDIPQYLNQVLSHDWESLRQEVKKYGLRNSLLTASMPTVSTSSIFGNSESFEPLTSNFYRKASLSGDYAIINRYLITDLIEKGLWSKQIKDLLIVNNGSIQNIASLSSDLKSVYKTVWEIRQRCLIDRALDRQLFIDQSQSMNLYVKEPTISRVSTMLFYSWSCMLKTGLYYLRTRPSADPTKVTIDYKIIQSAEQKDRDKGKQGRSKSKQNTDNLSCEVCQS